MKKEQHYENHLDDTTAKWFAVYTHYKREKVADTYLANMGIQTYLPLQELTRHYVRKTKKVSLPLINNYVFVKITKPEYAKVWQCPYVLKFVKFSENLISIPEEEIDLIKIILGEGENVLIDNDPFQKGDEVEIIGGRLTGLKGNLVERENNQFVSVRLTNIGLSLQISVATNLLRLVKPARLNRQG